MKKYSNDSYAPPQIAISVVENEMVIAASAIETDGVTANGVIDDEKMIAF